MGKTSQSTGERTKRQRQIRRAALALSITATFVLFEVALRLVPQAISPKLLILFEPGLRADIASGAYPLQKDFHEIARDDGGPPLFVAKPKTLIVSIDETKDAAERFTDENGFCNPPGRYEGRKQIDVITLGDSFTWCHAVVPEQAWPALLGEDTGLSVYSLGRGGNGPYEYLQYFREFGPAKHPRVVILNIYGGNDLRDAVAYRDYREALAHGEKPVSSSTRPIAPAITSSVVGRHSYALNFLLAAVSRLAGNDTDDWEKTGVNFRYTLETREGPVEFNSENRDRDEVLSARRQANGSTPLTIWSQALARFGQLAREEGFTAILSYTPSAFGAYRGHVQMADPDLLAELDAFDVAQRRFLAERAAPDGYVFHDLTDDLARAATQEGGPLYDPVHVHLSARGNRVVAESLAPLVNKEAALRPPRESPERQQLRQRPQ